MCRERERVGEWENWSDTLVSIVQVHVLPKVLSHCWVLLNRFLLYVCRCAKVLIQSCVNSLFVLASDSYTQESVRNWDSKASWSRWRWLAWPPSRVSWSSYRFKGFSPREIKNRALFYDGRRPQNCIWDPCWLTSKFYSKNILPQPNFIVRFGRQSIKLSYTFLESAIIMD